MKRTLFLTTLLVLTLFLASCITQPNGEELPKGDISISDGVEVVEIGEEVTISRSTQDLSYKITYDKRIAQLKVDDILVQANHIVLNENKAVVSYNNANNNEEYAGAIQILNMPASVQSNGKADGKEITFSNRQITAIYEKDNELIFGGAQDVDTLEIPYKDGEFAFVSFISNINSINNNTEIEINNNLINLPSKTVTGITEFKGKYYIATGNDKDNPEYDGIYVVENKSLADESYNIEDPRAITSNEDYVIVLDGSGKITFIDETDIVGTVETDTTITANSKATLEIYKGDLNNVSENEILLLASFSNNGVKGIKVDTSDFSREIIETSDDYSSNSVSTDGDLAIATEFGENSGSGFRIIEPIDQEGSDNITLYNKKTFSMTGDLYEEVDFSPNYVQYYELPGNSPDKPFANMLVAMGSYGVGIYDFEILEDYVYVEDDGFEEIKNLLNSQFPENENGVETINNVKKAYDWNFKLNILKDATLQVIFLDKNAGWNNSFGYQLNDQDELLFESINQGIYTGYTKEIQVNSGDVLKFFIDPKGKSNNRVYSGDGNNQIAYIADWNRHPDSDYDENTQGPNGHGYIYILSEDGFDNSLNDAIFVIKVKDDKLVDVVENVQSLIQLSSNENLE